MNKDDRRFLVGVLIICSLFAVGLYFKEWRIALFGGGGYERLREKELDWLCNSCMGTGRIYQEGLQPCPFCEGSGRKLD